MDESECIDWESRCNDVVDDYNRLVSEVNKKLAFRNLVIMFQAIWLAGIALNYFFNQQ